MEPPQENAPIDQEIATPEENIAKLSKFFEDNNSAFFKIQPNGDVTMDAMGVFGGLSPDKKPPVMFQCVENLGDALKIGRQAPSPKNPVLELFTKIGDHWVRWTAVAQYGEPQDGKESLLGFNVFGLKPTDEMLEAESKRSRRFLIDEKTGFYHRDVLADSKFVEKIIKIDPSTVLFVDVDNLKLVNDTLGHDLGDDLLRIVAIILKNTTKNTDQKIMIPTGYIDPKGKATMTTLNIAGSEIDIRRGGDEFLIILQGANIEQAKEVVGRFNNICAVLSGAELESELKDAFERIRDDIAREELKLEEILGLIKKISFSTGIAKIENGKLDEAIKQADQVMYEEKNRKKAARFREEQEKKYADVAEDISVT